MRINQAWTLAAAAIAVGATVAAAPVGAQQYFGQNQVQYDNFDWKILETEHFLVHFYPEEHEATVAGARMAERAYGRLSRLFDHQFREKKPIVFYASRADFGQNTVTGDLGEFVGGVTEALRHRILLPFTGDFESFDRVLTHEMVHEFQYDIFARGKAGGGLQALSQVQPPAWYMEGMAAYLEAGPGGEDTDAFLRDAAINGRIPTIEQMTTRPDRFNPYVYGEALWAYIGERWGDQAIGRIMSMVPSMGIERSFKRELGIELEELSEEWRDAMQVRHLPQIAELDRVRTFAQPLLTDKRTDGQIFLAPALSSDGRLIAFLSHGSILRGQIFIDLWLGDAETGERIERLVKSTVNPDFEELRLLYSQSSFSPDGRYLAFTAQRQGKDVLYLLDVRRRRTVKRFDLPLEGVTSPTWAPDGNRLAFSGSAGGVTDLYVIDRDGENFRRLTHDLYAEMQPDWSPDGSRIAFATDRSDESSLEVLRFSEWRIATLDVANGDVTLVPGQAGLNINPQFAPDGRSVAFVSDRTGIQNLFLYDFDDGEHYQLSNVMGAVMAGTQYSPAISWAREADRLAFTFFEDDDYTVWSVSDPRRLKRHPYRPPATDSIHLIAAGDIAAGDIAVGDAADASSVPGATAAPPDAGGSASAGDGTTAALTIASDSVAAADSATVLALRDTIPVHESYYRTESGFRPSAELPGGEMEEIEERISVVALLDSAALALPDTSSFEIYDYSVRFQPDYIARPSIGYVDGGYSSGLLGGTTIILSDMLGGHRLAFAGEVNGRFSDARLFASYTSLASRTQYTTGLYQTPYYYPSGATFVPVNPEMPEIGGTEIRRITRLTIRQVFGVAQYPFNRFTRAEYGARFSNFDRTSFYFSSVVDLQRGIRYPFFLDSAPHEPGINYFTPFLAYVSDNTLFGYTGPIYGRRYRFQVEQALGSLRWTEYTADYRRYDPILFNFLTVATRFMTSVAVGPDEDWLPKYIGRPEFVRGYDGGDSFARNCGGPGGVTVGCAATQLLGSRFALVNAELRFPLIRRFELGILPIALPPLDGLVFYDMGIAWTSGQTISFERPANFDEERMRYPLRSYGVGLRLNLFGFAIVRWDYAIPLDTVERDGFWTWTIGPSF
ncbi:MAG: hypothetical protein ACRENI_02070 [Gemmatimonadaceae bacterium]